MDYWGATATDWEHFIQLGLSKDLLPVVSKPNGKIASYSRLKTTGKTPSQYNKRREIVGIGEWTRKEATSGDIALWRAQEDYGICVQTRRVRALDIDVDDQAAADIIKDFVRDHLNGVDLPMRYRNDSGKCLFAFIVEGDLGKRTVRVDGGILEFLATGQQFVAAGTHPKGARYEWEWGLAGDIPVVSLDAFNVLWSQLCDTFGTEKAKEARGKREYTFTGEHSDKVSEFLVDNNYAHGQGKDGQVYIQCPFEHEHSTPSNGTDTAYFPAGSGGYDQGHFKCMHASCSHRTDADFLDAFGYRIAQFDVVEVEEEETTEKDLPEGWVRDKAGYPKATINNVVLALERSDIAGCIPAYDNFRDEIIFYSKDRKKWDRASDEFFIRLRRHLETCYGFYPIGREMIRDAVLDVAKSNPVDTAEEWLKAQQWDGIERIGTFYSDYMGVEDTPYTRAVSLYTWTGLAGRILVPGLKADMIPVLKSPEGYRKSSAIAAMSPSPDEFVEIDFNERDADLSRKMRGKLVAEVAELRGLRSRELESILAFVTRQHEEWIPKYREFSTTFPRRLIFIATTNEQEFLDGAREHRRWLPMLVQDQADVDAISRDRKQLWAEARERFLKDGLIFANAEKLARDKRSDFRITDSWEDAISTWLNTVDGVEEDSLTPAERGDIKTLDIARYALGLDPKSIRRGEEMRISAAMGALGYTQERRYCRAVKKQVRVWEIKENLA